MSDLADRFAPAPRRRSPAQLQRRRLAIDLSLALLIAVIFVSVAGGLGVVAWFGLPVLLIGLLTLAVERLVRRRQSRRQRKLPQQPA
jgi:Flp pilus assembly protein TadB